MIPEELINHFKAIENAVQQLIASKLPRMIGKKAVDIFHANFHEGGFINNGVQKWKLPKRYNAKGKAASARYGPLLSARKELYNSISYRIDSGRVIISSDKTYAEAHNEGFSGTIQVPEHNRRTKNGVSKVKAHSKSLTLPQRQFMGESAELNKIVTDLVIKELKAIFV